MYRCLWRCNIVILVALFATAAYADGKVETAVFVDLSKELEAGQLSKMEIVALNDGVETPAPITPELFDGMSDASTGNSLFMSHCNLDLPIAAQLFIAHLFVHAAEKAVESKPGGVHWRMTFRNLSGDIKHVIYMGPWYINYPLVNIIYNSNSMEVPKDFETWFVTNVNLENCTMKY
jgi:hypothetical protein